MKERRKLKNPLSLFKNYVVSLSVPVSSKTTKICFRIDKLLKNPCFCWYWWPLTTANLPKTMIGLRSDKMISSYNDCISSAVTVHWLRTVAHICQILCNTCCKRPIPAAVMFRDINKGDARWRTFLWAFLYLQVNQMHLELLISFFVIIFTKRICLITSI